MSTVQPPADVWTGRDNILDPSAQEILSRVLPLYIINAGYRALVETAAAEQGARRTAMKNATDNADEVRTDLTRRACGHLSMRLAGTYAMQVFGKPDRVVNCDCERDNQPTLLQSVFLQNDPLMDQRLEQSGWLTEIAESAVSPDLQQLVREAWLRTISRPPTAKELTRGVNHLESADTVVDGMRDLLWALMNTKEFILIK